MTHLVSFWCTAPWVDPTPILGESATRCSGSSFGRLFGSVVLKASYLTKIPRRNNPRVSLSLPRQCNTFHAITFHLDTSVPQAYSLDALDFYSLFCGSAAANVE
jgi:hypothetical protein